MTDKLITNRYNVAASIVSQSERIKANQPVKTTDARTQNTRSIRESSFREMLDKKIAQQGISFSKHAVMRTSERNIEVTGEDLTKLGDACSKAGAKGIKDALFIMKDSAFIVNTPNRTVVTVVDKNEMKDNIFTNIDGAMFL